MLIKILGEPVAKGRPRFGNGRAYTPAKTAKWEHLAAWTAREQYGCLPPVEGAIAVTVEAVFAIPPSWTKARRLAAAGGSIRHVSRPDGDNLLKAVGDSLNGIVWLDDSQITIATVKKRYGDVPGVSVWVETLSP